MYLVDFIIAKHKYIKKYNKEREKSRLEKFKRYTKDSICKNCQFVYIDSSQLVRCVIKNEVIDCHFCPIKECEYFKTVKKKEGNSR